MWISMEDVFDYIQCLHEFEENETFVSAMERLGQIDMSDFPHTLLIINGTMWPVGENWILFYQGENDNEFGAI